MPMAGSSRVAISNRSGRNDRYARYPTKGDIYYKEDQYDLVPHCNHYSICRADVTKHFCSIPEFIIRCIGKSGSKLMTIPADNSQSFTAHISTQRLTPTPSVFLCLATPIIGTIYIRIPTVSPRSDICFGSLYPFTFCHCLTPFPF